MTQNRSVFGEVAFTDALVVLAEGIGEAPVQAVFHAPMNYVEIDEALVGGVEHGGKPGRGTDKCIVAIAVEVKQPKGFGRVRMRHIPDASDFTLRPFVCEMVAPGSTILTDGWSGYSLLSQWGYTQKKIIVSSSGAPAQVAMPGVHRIASLLKRWILGAHQNSVSDVHLQSCFDEFILRFIRSTLRSRGLVFRRLLEQMVTPVLLPTQK